MIASRVLILVAGLMLLWFITRGRLAFAQEATLVRPPAFAGSWYPGDVTALAKLIDELLAKAAPPEITGKPRGLIAPHAGYQYSAPTAAAAYATLRGHTYQRVIVIAFSHRYASRYRGVDVPKDLRAYKTPLGEVPLDRAACAALLKSPAFSSNAAIGDTEHSLELQLPFLQRVLKNFNLVPLLVGEMTDADFARAAQALGPLVDDETLLVASSDFTHYGPNYGFVPFKDDVEHKLRALADQAAAPLLRCDYDGFVADLAQTHDTICGRGPICLLLRTLALKGGAQGTRTAYETSGHLVNDWENSVTYQSFVFTPRIGTLNADERRELLRLARQSVTAYVLHQKSPDVNTAALPPKLRADGACFVTLENHGELRGCIGNMVADGPLYEAVMRNAVSACQDPRFVDQPVTAQELDQLHIEISYLSPMKRVKDPNEIVVGQHGLLISFGPQRGVLLPQVAYERGWTREEFLSQTCRKAGLPPQTWKQPNATIESFEAEVFGEPEP